jgi:hypothetical protein
MLANGVNLKRPPKRVVGVVARVVGEGTEVKDVGVGVLVPLSSALLLHKPKHLTT